MKTKTIIIISLLVVLILSVVLSKPDMKNGYLKINSSSIPKTISAGDIFTIELTTNLSGNNIKFQVSDTSVALVNSEGLVTALKSGKVTIKVTSIYEDLKPLEDTVNIKIKD